MKKIGLIFSLLYVTVSMTVAQSKVLHDWQLISPDGAYILNITQESITAGKKQLYYKLSYNNKQVVEKSELGINLDNQLFESALAIENDTSKLWCENLDFVNESNKLVQEVWSPVYGERNQVKDHYREIVLRFSKYGEPAAHSDSQHDTSYDKRRSYVFEIIFRAYDQGIAFKYSFPESSNGLFLHITGEQTAFSFAEGTKAYYERWAQGPYFLQSLKNWKDESERPLTLILPNGLYVSLLEAQMIDYSRTKFKLSKNKSNTLLASIYGAVDVIPPFSTSWRVIMAADRAGKLIENNDLLLNLNSENQIKNNSWIKPGKVIRSGKLTNDHARACIDFAAAHGLQYVHLDAGWYGPEMKMASEASKVSETHRDLDIQELVNYGAKKGIGIFIYVNQRALIGDLDKLFGLYQRWGIKGVKFGFVQIGSNRWSIWLHDAVKKAAQYQLLVDIHDEYRPTGFSRTYPNLLTQEGIRGNEEMPDATHNTILPYTRFLAGAADYTICYYNSRIKTTHAHQLALSVVYYSPLQFLYWYDGPDDFNDEPEIAFFDNVKTIWDDTRILDGKIGEYIATARRSNEEWFVGLITNNDSREVPISFDFLKEGKIYQADIYEDDDSQSTRTKVALRKIEINSQTRMSFSLKPSGGVAIHIYPKK